MSGVEWFDDGQAINAFMNARVPVDREKAAVEHRAISNAFTDAGIKVVQVKAPENCQDGVYTANWALVRGEKAVLARLPNARTAEEPYAAQVLQDLGKTVHTVPEGFRFSGQGDALACGDFLFAGSTYRSDPAAQQFAADTLGYTLIQLQTIPLKNWLGRPVTNKASGWPDSYFYDIDLALAVLRDPDETNRGLVAWCPAAFTPESQQLMRDFTGVEKIEVEFAEAKEAFACNLVSTGQTIIMSSTAPRFQETLKQKGFKLITPPVSELAKGGGYIRCTSLSLD